MINSDKSYSKAAYIYLIASIYRLKHTRVNIILLQPSFQDTKSQSCTIYWNIQLLQHVWQCTYMILMAMSQHYSLNLFLILYQISNIRNNQVYAKHLLIGKHQA